MYYYGRDRRRRYRKMLKRTLLALAAVVVFMLGRFLFFSSHNAHEDVVSVAAIGNSLSANEILPDTVFSHEIQGGLQKDSRYIAEQRNNDEKQFSNKEDLDRSLVEKLGTKGFDKFYHSRQKVRSFYQVVSEAHFYDKPTELSRRKDVIEYWNVSNGSIKPLAEKNGFIYVVYRQPLGPTKKGWLRKKDLKKVTTTYEDNKD